MQQSELKTLNKTQTPRSPIKKSKQLQNYPSHKSIIFQEESRTEKDKTR